MKNKLIALVDYKWSGHHPMYLTLYTKLLVELGAEVVVLCAQPDEFLALVKPELGEQIEKVRTLDIGKDRPLERKIKRGASSAMMSHRWMNVSRILSKFEREAGKQVDLVFFNYLDEMLEPMYRQVPALINSRFKYKWSGLLFHIKSLDAQDDARKWFHSSYLDMLKTEKCQFLTTLVENKIDYLHKETEKEVIAFPDISTKELPQDPNSLELIQQIKTKAAGRKIVALVGSIAHRKGFVNFLKAAESMSKEDYFFVAAGKLTPRFEPDEVGWMLKYFVTQPENVMPIFELISDQEFDAIIDLADVLYAAYLGFQSSSNMLVKSALMETPIIVTADTLMADRVEKFNTGITVPEGDIEAITTAIRQLAHEPNQYSEGFDALRKEHSIESQRERFNEVLAKI